MISHRLRQGIEALLICLFSAWIPRLSRDRVLRMAARWGDAGYRHARRLRSVGEANLLLAYGQELDDATREAILRSAFRNFALLLLDTFWFSRDTARRIQQWVIFDEAGFAPLFRPAAHICITAHLGNWEVLGMAFATGGHPLVSVAAPLDNPIVDQMFNDMRKRTGQQVISKHGALRHLIKTLRAQGKIAMLLDQNTKPSDGGLFVPFFGRPVPVSSAAAALWRRTGAEIFFGVCLPEPDGHYRVPPVERVPTPSATDESPGHIEQVTAAIAQTTERYVRRYPGHWLWMYKRWKFVPPGESRERYPYYAKELPTTGRP
jgi:Kdo2-lipid IVA lauroyltransferase/acyltransferase